MYEIPSFIAALDKELGAKIPVSEKHSHWIEDSTLVKHFDRRLRITQQG